MQKIIEEVQPTENDVFVDLGSGVGKNFIKLVSILIVSKFNLIIVSLLTKNHVSISNQQNGNLRELRTLTIFISIITLFYKFWDRNSRGLPTKSMFRKLQEQKIKIQ